MEFKTKFKIVFRTPKKVYRMRGWTEKDADDLAKLVRDSLVTAPTTGGYLRFKMSDDSSVFVPYEELRNSTIQFTSYKTLF